VVHRQLPSFGVASLSSLVKKRPGEQAGKTQSGCKVTAFSKRFLRSSKGETRENSKKWKSEGELSIL
jgi:hypothetical protein